MTFIVWNINSCICASGIGMTIPTLWDGYRRYRQSWIARPSSCHTDKTRGTPQ
ncbi:MAG: hypothetical protein IPO14_11160 [Saprospiraceae bacterium]|nr:hypothetical protein [Saprospiraceae bacterium]